MTNLLTWTRDDITGVGLALPQLSGGCAGAEILIHYAYLVWCPEWNREPNSATLLHTLVPHWTLAEVDSGLKINSM